MKLGTLYGDKITEFLQHTNPLSIDCVEVDEQGIMVKFRVHFDNGLALRVKSGDGETSTVQKQHDLFQELIALAKAGIKNKVIEN